VSYLLTEMARDFDLSSHLQSSSVTNLMSHLCRSADLVLTQSWKELISSNKPICLLAIGGYGRGEMYPQSDCDVLILSSSYIETTQQNQIDLWVQRVWDSGITLAQSLKSMSEIESHCLTDIKFQTSLLDVRFLSGSKEIYQHFLHIWQKLWKKHEFFVSFFERKKNEQQQRYLRYQNNPFSLEPNVKESPGALRDGHQIQWLTKAFRLAGYTSASNTLGLTEIENIRLRQALNHLKKIRFQIHLIRPHKNDVLGFDIRESLAEVLLFSSNKVYSSSERLMRFYYQQTRQVGFLNDLLHRAIQAFLVNREKISTSQTISPFLVQHHGVYRLCHPHLLDQHPEKMWDVLISLSHHLDSGEPSVCLLRSLRAVVEKITPDIRAKWQIDQKILQFLNLNQGVTRIMRLMIQLGILQRYIPSFRRVSGLIQQDLFHAYTVDIHTLMVIRNIRRLFLERYQHEFPKDSARTKAIKKPALLYLAALFHDIGKGSGVDHSIYGEKVAKRFCQQHLMSFDETELVIFLVRNHLLLSQTAQTQDLSDQQTIRKFCDVVKTTERLTYLYLLTVADIRATDPKLWNGWKAELLESLYLQALAVFNSSEKDPVEEKLDMLIQYGFDRRQLLAFWGKMGDAYVMQHTEKNLLWHAETILKKDGEIICEMKQHKGFGEILVSTKDSSYLLARVLSVFQAAGLIVHQAFLHTSQEGLVVDHFYISHFHELNEFRIKDSSPQWFEGIKRMLLSVLSSEEKEIRLPQIHLGRLSPRARHFPLATKVQCLWDEKQKNPLLLVTCHDRVGLFYAISVQLARLGVSILLAKINTLGQRVEDVFVLDVQPFQKNPSLLQAVEQAILSLHI
jgi:[protein-PII] uridylyltransferase